MMRNASHKLAPLPTPRSRYSQQEQKHIQVYASAYTHTCIMPGHTKPARTRARDASGRGGSHLHGVLDELAGTSLGLLPRHPALLDVARGDPVHTTDKGGVGLAAIRVPLLDTVDSGTGTTVQSGDHATMAVHKRCNNHEYNPAHDSRRCGQRQCTGDGTPSTTQHTIRKGASSKSHPSAPYRWIHQGTIPRTPHASSSAGAAPWQTALRESAARLPPAPTPSTAWSRWGHPSTAHKG